ncbi:MAG: hypothetical protein ACYDB9_08490 [Gammaproteobacteria bacterium]
MYTKMVLIGLATLMFTACATVSPARRFAGSVAAAQQAHRPLVIYRLNTQTNLGYYPFYRMHGRYAAFTQVGFINTAQQPIERVVFQLSAYDGNRRVLDTHGRPLTRALIALGPFAAGHHGELVSKDPVWTSRNMINSCARLTGIRVFYADGSSVAVGAAETPRYLTPQISPSGCTYYPPGFAMRGGGAVGTGDDPDGDGPGR